MPQRYYIFTELYENICLNIEHLKCAGGIMIKRDCTYYWFTLKDTERKWLMWSLTILLYIRFLHKPQLWFWLCPFFSKQCVKIERLEIFQTMAKHKEKEDGNWNELYICEILSLRAIYFVTFVTEQHSILKIPKVRCILCV